MSNSKDKRIQKLKKKRIWPSILGLFVITFIFAIILIVQLGVSAIDVIQSKIISGISQTETVAVAFEDYEGEQKQKIQDSVLNYVEMTPEIDSVWVSDLNDKEIWASGDKTPNIKNTSEIYFTEDESINLILEENFSSGIQFQEDMIVINEDIFSELDADVILESGLGFEDRKEIVKLKVWYMQEVDGLKVYVLQDIKVYVYDFFMLLTSTILFCIMIAIFILYYLISFISVIVSMRKTSKVIYTDMTTGGNNWLYFVKKGNRLLKKKAASNDYAVIHFKMRKYRSFCTCFGVKEGEVLIEKCTMCLRNI